MESFTKASLSEEVTLSFAGLAVSFHCRSESVNVPGAFASRSQLLVDLRGQDDAADDVPVPLPFDSLKAWLAFLEERDGDQGSPADNRDCNLSDTALLQALEAADFLQDEGTACVLTGILAHAFEPAAGAATGGAENPWQLDASPSMATPTQTQTERALKILQAAEPRTILRLLSAVDPPPDSTARFEHTSQRRHADRLRYLFALVPLRLHPAVLLARCPSIQSSGAVHIPKMGWEPAQSEQEGDREGASACEPTLPAVAAALLAAGHFAKPAAGGGGEADVEEESAVIDEAAFDAMIPPSFKLWVASMHPQRTRKRTRSTMRGASLSTPPGSKSDDSDGSLEYGSGEEGSGVHSSKDAGGGGGKGCSSDGGSKGGSGSDAEADADGPLLPSLDEIIPAATQEAGGAVTRLRLAVPPEVPPIWRDALPGICTLRSLTLEIASIFDQPAVSFGITLHLLSALTALHICADLPAYIDVPSNSQRVLGAICALPQLSALSLDGCFITRTDTQRSREPIRVDETFDQLSRLTGLTYLSLRDNLISRRGVGTKLMKALRRMKVLRELSAANTDFGMKYVLKVVTEGALPALRALDLGSFWMRSLEALNHVAVVNASAGGLTALGMAHGESFPPSDAEATKVFKELPQAFPALQYLDMRHCIMHDSGLTHLAAVLPQMPALRSLDVGHNAATAAGVVAVLSAAQQPCKEGRAGLRQVGVAGAEIGPERAGELAALLAGLTALEEVDVAEMKLEGAGVRRVAQELQGLPHLHGLTVSANGQSAADVEAAVPLLAGLTALRRLAMHEAAVSDTVAVRQAIERAAPWVSAVTLAEGYAENTSTDVRSVVAWGSQWKPLDPETVRYF